MEQLAIAESRHIDSANKLYNGEEGEILFRLTKRTNSQGRCNA